jgi:hypothetical protein
MDGGAAGGVEHCRSGSVWLGIRKIGLLIPAVLLAVNVWTGFPLLALWIGSQVQGGGSLAITTVFTVVLSFAALVFAAAVGVSWLNLRYDELTGKRSIRRERFTLAESLTGPARQQTRRERGVNAIEKAVIASVVVAVLAFEVWFFLFAGSPLPS